jgi:hypothetical protein
MTAVTSWWIGLPAWVLQDGNHADFATGERRQFALEWWYDRSQRLRPASGPARCTAREDGSYDVTGRLLRAAAEPMSDAFVLDFGLRAYTQWMVLDDLQPPSAGAWLSGRIWLGVDPFMYLDDLAGRPGMPPLIHTWTIDEIQVEEQPGARRRVVPRTHTWDDVGGYWLRCTLHSDEPVSSTSSSTSSAVRSPTRGRPRRPTLDRDGP